MNKAQMVYFVEYKAGGRWVAASAAIPDRVDALARLEVFKVQRPLIASRSRVKGYRMHRPSA